jgi:predicted  nucleic acid-binding Zn-ribbon protein
MIEIDNLVMIATRNRSPDRGVQKRSLPRGSIEQPPSRRSAGMETLTSGTITGAGSFRCLSCDYVLTLVGSETLMDCPRCGGEDFARASLFRAGRIDASAGSEHENTLAHRGERDFEHEETLTGHSSSQDLSERMLESEREALLAEARERVDQPGEYVVYEEGGEWRTVALTREWTRIGRSLAADVRFDDPTVSRRHALIVRQPDGVRVLDDRSLNGVFVNGARIEGKTLEDGDEILVGRYRLSFLSVASA